jgi:hypothetical protein
LSDLLLQCTRSHRNQSDRQSEIGLRADLALAYLASGEPAAAREPCAAASAIADRRAGTPDCRRAEEDEACRASPVVKFSQ